MKASIERLRRLTSHKVDVKDKGEIVSTAQIDELARAGKDMQDMRDCYDRLLSAAAATANSAYEFSESLGEMGSCLEQIAPHNDEESSRILFMLGKVQYELQRLLDTYRSHISKTITFPSEALLKDLRTVEDMKQQCDEKRNVFEMALVKDKGRSKISKGERHIPPESRPAYNEFHDEATMCIFRLKSLKEGQARSLLTQAVRHHTAQMRLFHTGLKSLDAVERHVRVAAEKQHIDCDLSVHENEVEASEDDYDDDDDDDDGRYINREDELSFAYRSNEQKMDDTDLSFPRHLTTRPAAVNADHREEYSVSIRDHHRMNSHSAPLFPEKKPDVSERLRQANPSFNAYVLPTPNDSRYSKPASQALNPRPSANHSTGNIWHTSALEPVKSGKDGKDAENNNLCVRLPRPSTTDTHYNQQQQATTGRHAFSGPLKPSSTKPVTTTNSDVSSGAFCPLPTPPVPQPHPPHSSSSPRVSPSASPPPASSSSPRLNELHELPRPPRHFPPPPRRAKSPSLVGHSAPLTGWNQERNNVTVTAPSATNIVASPLPVPPLVIPRSYSIPSRNQRAVAQRPVERDDDSVASPPLTPMSLSRPLPQATGVAQTSQIRGVGKLIER